MVIDCGLCLHKPQQLNKFFEMSYLAFMQVLRQAQDDI